MFKPSTYAKASAKRRSKAKGRTDAPMNIMDVLRVLDVLSKKMADLEKEVRGKRDY